jgi:hypothetical protein
MHIAIPTMQLRSSLTSTMEATSARLVLESSMANLGIDGIHEEIVV